MKKIRNVLFWLHLTGGCVAGLVILTMSVTGILLAFERQIDAWADAPAVLQIETGSAPKEPIDAFLTILKNSGLGKPSQLVVHKDAKEPVEARFGRDNMLYLNPWTAEVIGQPSESARSFFAFVERIHRSMGLGMQSALGRGITGAANLVFLFMLISGLWLWLPKAVTLASFKNRLLFRRGVEGRAREWNWHHVVGFWTVLPLVFIVASGAVMSYPWASNLLYTMTGTKPPAGGWRGERSGPGNKPGRTTHNDGTLPAEEFRSLDQLALTVKHQVPAWKSMTIEVPQPDEPMLSLSVDTSIGGQPEKSSQFVINRRSGVVEKITQFRDNNAGRKLRAWARFVHTGEEFGIAGEAIAALASLGAVLLVWTGSAMALRRLRGRRQAAVNVPDLPGERRNVEAGDVLQV